MNYTDAAEAGKYGVSNKLKMEFYQMMHQGVYGEDFNPSTLKTGDYSFAICTAKVFLEKFFYLDKAYYIWDVYFPNGWAMNIESYESDEIPAGANQMGSDIYQQRGRAIWKELMEKRDMRAAEIKREKEQQQ